MTGLRGPGVRRQPGIGRSVATPVWAEQTRRHGSRTVEGTKRNRRSQESVGRVGPIASLGEAGCSDIDGLFESGVAPQPQ